MRTAVLGAAVLPPIRGKSKPAGRATAKAKPEPRLAQAKPRPAQSQQATGTSAAAVRGAGETWPLPRISVASAAEKKTPPAPEDPAEKAAGGS